MKSLMSLWSCLSAEYADWCSCTDTTFDRKTIERRVEHEGLSFLTITLPSFGKDFQKSLDRGYVADDVFVGFNRHGGLPRFLGGFLQLVFSRENGLLLDGPNTDAIEAIQMLTALFSKLPLECTDTRTKAAIRQYVEIEKQVRESDRFQRPSDIARFERISGLLFSNIFTEMDKLVYNGELVPKHGPGNTAERLTSNGKYRLSDWTLRLEEYFPFVENACSSWQQYLDLLDTDGIRFRSPEQEIPVRVITVPKTMKTPRIIAIEPTCMQFMQQSVLEGLVSSIRKDSVVHRMIGFEDQTPNQRLALEGSRDGTFATLDLSEASDRVSNQHVLALLRRWPHFSGAVQCCRSRKADVPGHGVIRLAKFASMGSALCFPMEAAVFLTVVFMGIEDELDRPITRRDIVSLSSQVRVYGDDIIVPTDYADSVSQSLHCFGFVVNETKSFQTGRFRESCGKEYWDGEDVSPIKLRSDISSLRARGPELASYVAFRNLLYTRGLWRTAYWVDSQVEPLLRGFYPKIHPTSPVIGRVTFGQYSIDRYHPTLHKPMVKAYTLQSKSPSDKLDDYGAQLKFFLKRISDPYDEDHLNRAGRPRVVRVKLGWNSPY